MHNHRFAWPRIQTRVRTILMIVVIVGASGSLGAQWFKYPESASAANRQRRRRSDGGASATGEWQAGSVRRVDDRGARSVSSGGPHPISELLKLNPPSRKCPPRTASFSRQSINIGIDMPGGLPYQPWLAKLVDERTANQAIDDPHIRCLPDFFLRAYGLPHYLKFVQTPDLLVMLNEYNGTYRQVFTDGRPLPEAPNPSWQGYSTATWDGDTLVIDTHRLSRRPVDRLGRQHDHRGGKGS